MQTAKRAWWRFSLREALLVVAALAALLALWASTQPYAPSLFMTSLVEEEVFREVCASTDPPLAYNPAFTTMAGGPSDPASEGQRELDLTLQAPGLDDFQKQVMPEVERRVERLLEETGAEVLDHSRIITPGAERVMRFGIRYRSGPTHGRIRVYSFEQPPDRVRVLVLLEEW